MWRKAEVRFFFMYDPQSLFWGYFRWKSAGEVALSNAVLNSISSHVLKSDRTIFVCAKWIQRTLLPVEWILDEG